MSVAIARISICPKRMPMQVREPPPKGTYAPFGSAAFASREKRAGMKRSGSGKISGRWWLTQEE